MIITIIKTNLDLEYRSNSKDILTVYIYMVIDTAAITCVSNTYTHSLCVDIPYNKSDLDLDHFTTEISY